MKVQDCTKKLPEIPKVKSLSGFDVECGAEDHFTSVFPLPVQETIDAYKAEPGKFGVHTKRDGNVCTLTWEWTGGEVAKLEQKVIDKLVVLADMGLCAWDLELKGYDESARSWYARRVNLDGKRTEDPVHPVRLEDGADHQGQ